MIDVRALEKPEGAEEYRRSLKNRGEDPKWVDKIADLNLKRKSIITQQEQLRAEQNRVGEEIAKKKRAKEDASEMLTRMQGIAGQVKELDAKVAAAEAELNEVLMRLPNKLHSSVPVGEGADDNVVVRADGVKGTFAFKAKEHWELGEKLGILDFERAGKVTGARFTFLRGAAAALERALIQFMMDVHAHEHGYEEMIPPFIANSLSFTGTGQFPKFQDDVFHLGGTDYHLIPTAEVPVTNFYAGEILKESELPAKFVAYSPCFRSEAGSYGKDTRGLIRQHQFNKVELVIFAHPDKSYELHDQLTRHAEKILQKLELPYRVMNLCSRDIGFGAAKCHDLEVWLPGQNAYREISSCSNFEDFQARRAGIRFKGTDAKAKPQFVHTLNGSGLAIGRTLIAILENYQQEDGSVVVPKALEKYMGGLSLITAKK
ncbi:MAG TPA: serine--tRNA ligase [Bdellovibrionales bacterium]|nr:serine--tRNA ligase [Bdellovibrionales bacterium]